MRTVSLEIPETNNSYTNKHATCSDGNRWVRLDLANEMLDSTRAEYEPKTFEAIASSGGNKHVNVGTEGHIDHALAIKDLNRLRQFYTREGAINLIKEYWPDLIQLYTQREELITELERIEKYGHGVGHGSGYTCANMAQEAITKAGESHV